MLNGRRIVLICFILFCGTAVLSAFIQQTMDSLDRVVAEYLVLIGEKELPQNLFEVVEIEDRFPVERIHRLLNERGEDRSPAEEDETN